MSEVGDNTTITAANLNEYVKAAVDSAMAKWSEKINFLESEIIDLKEENRLLKDQMNKMGTITAIKSIDADVYNRKWNVIIHGIDGAAGEAEDETAKKVREMAAENLKIPCAMDSTKVPFAACHRLAQKDNAGIIVRFTNLNDRNYWLSNGRELRNSAKNYSISPDLPPILKPLKSEILNHRKDHPNKKLCKVKYTKSWPYISLNLPNGSTFKPQIKLNDIVKKFYTPTSPGFYPCEPY